VSFQGKKVYKSQNFYFFFHFIGSVLDRDKLVITIINKLIIAGLTTGCS